MATPKPQPKKPGRPKALTDDQVVDLALQVRRGAVAMGDVPLHERPRVRGALQNERGLIARARLNSVPKRYGRFIPAPKDFVRAGRPG